MLVILMHFRKYFSDFFNVSSISTGVLGDTGIESAEIIKGVVNQINPDCVIAVDALAASSASRLGNTVQLCNAGISPGSTSPPPARFWWAAAI